MRSLATSLLFTAAQALSVGVISDIHLVKYWSELTSVDDRCFSSGTEKALIKAPMGRYGCDAPANLTEYMLQRLTDTWGQPDIILFPGDHVSHGLS